MNPVPGSRMSEALVVVPAGTSPAYPASIKLMRESLCLAIKKLAQVKCRQPAPSAASVPLIFARVPYVMRYQCLVSKYVRLREQMPHDWAMHPASWK